MQVLLTFTFSFNSSWHTSAVFYSNIDSLRLSTGTPVLNNNFIDLAALTGFPTSLTVIIVALTAYMGGCSIACIMICSADIPFCICYVLYYLM